MGCWLSCAPSFIRSLRSVMNCGRHSWLLTLMVSIPIADTVNSELLEFIYVDSVLLDDRADVLLDYLFVIIKNSHSAVFTAIAM